MNISLFFYISRDTKKLFYSLTISFLIDVTKL